MGKTVYHCIAYVVTPGLKIILLRLLIFSYQITEDFFFAKKHTYICSLLLNYCDEIMLHIFSNTWFALRIPEMKYLNYEENQSITEIIIKIIRVPAELRFVPGTRLAKYGPHEEMTPVLIYPSRIAGTRPSLLSQYYPTLSLCNKISLLYSVQW